MPKGKTFALYKHVADYIFERTNGSIDKKIITQAVRIIIQEIYKELSNRNSIYVENFGTIAPYKRVGYWTVKFYPHKKLKELVKIFKAEIHNKIGYRKNSNAVIK